MKLYKVHKILVKHRDFICNEDSWYKAQYFYPHLSNKNLENLVNYDTILDFVSLNMLYIAHGLYQVHLC